jgi:hypothetical protein
MTDICERLVVHCPQHEAAHRLAAFVAEHRSENGSLSIALRLPIAMFAAWKVTLERRAVASFYSLSSAADSYPTYSVAWSSAGGGAFPEFAGALAVERTLLRECFSLVLSGHYQPPFGAVGAVFDVGLGKRIARGSVRDLLRSIADHVERASADRTSDWRSSRAPAKMNGGPKDRHLFPC